MRKQWCIYLAIVSLLVGSVACRFSEREIPIDNTNIATSNPEDRSGASSNGGVEVASLDVSKAWAPSNLQTYRAEYHMEAWFNDDTEESKLTTSMIIEVTSDPPAQHVTIAYGGEMIPEEIPSMETEMYIFGGIAYMKSNYSEEWMAFEGDLADLMSDTLLNPQDYVALPEKAERDVTAEIVNGISSWHYTFDEDDIENPIVEYEEVRTETWIAVEGGFIVKLESFAKGADLSEDLDENLFTGILENSRVHTTYEMKDINVDFTIVLPPEAAEAEISDFFSQFDSEWTRDDVPFPAEADIEYSFEDSISLQTHWTVQQTKDFMLTQMQTYGWVLEMEYMNSEDYYMGDYIKDKDYLTLSIEKDIINPDMTSIHVMVKEIVDWAREDVPLPQDALILQSFEGEVQLLTFLSLEDASETMIAQLEANDWASETESFIADYRFIGSFVKGNDVLSLIIDPGYDEQSRTRIWITIE
jgi:hypothetical protein